MHSNHTGRLRPFGRRSARLIALSSLCFSVAGFAAPHRAPKTYDLKNVEWHVTLHPETASIDGDVINSIHLLGVQNSVTFDCGPLTIASVTVNGAKVTSTLNNETLTVPLPDGGAKVDYKVEIKYSGKPTAGIYFVPAKSAYPAHTPVVYTQGEAEDNRCWLPTYDYPDNKATSEGFITIPSGWDALSNGRRLATRSEGAMSTIHYKMDKPHSTYLISLVAGPYEVGHEKWGDMPVEYWVPQGLMAEGKAAFGGTGNIIDVFSKLTGFPYPYAKFAQAAVPDFMFGGMENITCVTQTISTLHSPDAEPLENSTGLVAHELAHQWFGDTVTCADWSHAWLNEGFATFMPPFYTRATEGEEAFQAERSGIFQQASLAATTLNKPIVWDGYNIPMDNFLSNAIYPGGASRMYMLMDQLGEKAFWSGIHDYLEAYKYQPVTTEKFFASMSKSTGKDLTPFMKEWFYSKGVPHVSFRTEGHTIIFTQVAPYYDFSPEVWLWDGKGWFKKSVTFTSGAAEARLDVPENLANAPLLLDPEGHILMVQDSKQNWSNEQRAAIFDNLPAFWKSRLVNTLGILGSEGILKLMDEPGNKFYRPMLVRQFGQGTEDILVKLLSDSDAKVRSAALQRLSIMGSANEGFKAALKKLSTDDPNISIRTTAAALLLRSAVDPAEVEKAWNTDSYHESLRVAAMGWWQQHDAAQARKRAIEALDGSATEPVRTLAIRFLGMLRDLPGEHVAYDHLVAVMKGTGYGERVQAMFALVSYGNKEALPLIEPLRHESLFFTRQFAEQAYGALQSGRGG
jgi:aminopeptidase N